MRTQAECWAWVHGMARKAAKGRNPCIGGIRADFMVVSNDENGLFIPSAARGSMCMFNSSALSILVVNRDAPRRDDGSTWAGGRHHHHSLTQTPTSIASAITTTAMAHGHSAASTGP